MDDKIKELETKIKQLEKQIKELEQENTFLKRAIKIHLESGGITKNENNIQK